MSSEDHVRHSPPICFASSQILITKDKDAISVMVTGAKKELAYLDRFGSPRAPYRHLHRESYNYEKQLPSDHTKNLHHYLRLAPSLVPDDDTLRAFCIRHPDLSDSNIKVLKDSQGLQIHSLLDWQHTVVLPLFLYAGMPNAIQNEGDEVSRSMVKPELPHTFDQLSKEDQEWEKELLRRRLVHFRYILSTTTYNETHLHGLVYPFSLFRRHTFKHASAPWEGETIELQCALMDIVRGWAVFAKSDELCPVVFTEGEKAAAEKLYLEVMDGKKSERQLREIIGYGEETWVPAAKYETAKALGQEIKRMMLENEETTEEIHARIEANWLLDDMDEDVLEEYK